ncbi:hypothetical protein B566_EDAN007227 [Ephemera danica]|nr:hypothetical protein B566_EDAN007227 [Ephemera danica]
MLLRVLLLPLLLTASVSCQQTNNTNRPDNVVISSVQVSTAPIVIVKPKPKPGGTQQNSNRRLRQLDYDEFYPLGLQDTAASYHDSNLGRFAGAIGLSPQALPYGFSQGHPAYNHALRYQLNSPADLGFSGPNGFLQSSPQFIPRRPQVQRAPISSARARPPSRPIVFPSGPGRVSAPSAQGRFIPTGQGISGVGFSAPSGLGPLGPGVTFSGAAQQCEVQIATCDPQASYRTLDGSCNNLKQPRWGMAGVQAPVDEGLPLPRVLSYTLFPNLEIADPMWTLAAMQWAQLITHDMSMAAGSRQHKPHAIRCCAQDGHDVVNDLSEQAGCFPIRIPAEDPFYSRHNQRCMDFVRSSNDVANGCSNGPAQQMTAVTSYLDLSIVYGSSDDTLRGLREFRGGRLVVARRGGREWLPESNNRTADCETADDEEACYRSGDVRVNQNPGQAVLQTILLREHNRLADALAALNPHWDDETLLQEARRINVAQVQRITYYEWLPILLGAEETVRRGLVQADEGYSHDYDEATDATAINDHATGAFRHLHTLIPSQIIEVDSHRQGVAGLRFSDVLNRPAVIEVGRSFDQILRGLASQPQHAPDRFFSAEITQFLFRAGKPFGGDLRSIDVQRGRDHGLPGYNAYRELCGLPRAHTFKGFADVMDLEAAEGLASLYANPDDVDMLVGGGLERNAEEALAGPTFVCIMAEQFRRARQGDRFWFELGGQPGSFTPGQVQELRKSSLSRLMCDNADGVHAMQLRAFQQPSFRNPVVACADIPAIDLTFWDAHDPADLPLQQAHLIK